MSELDSPAGPANPISANPFKVTVLKNGPLRVTGEDIQLLDPSGNAFGLGGRTTISLCRCGLSSNKPFCDGSHNHHGFVDEPQARDLPPKV
jgi:CDGSH-type Zn-finger protein